MANISPEVLSLIDSFSGQIVSLFKDIKDDIKHFIDDGLLEYENNQYNKFIKTKTFLCRNENVNFYNIYFPLSIKIGNEIKRIENNTQSIFEKKNYIGIIGSAGSGKTMLMKYIFLECLKKAYKIPIVLELRNLNNYEHSISDYIITIIFNNKLSPNKKILEKLLNSGNFLFLLDGYDELYSDKKASITNDLDIFIDKYSKNDYLITSRPGANLESIPRFDNYFVCPLDQKQIEPFIKQQLIDIDQKDVFLNKIMDSIRKPENKDYNTYLTSPLLLSMFILTFESYPELPKTKSKFYWNVYDTLCTKHDTITKKGGYLHERKTKLLNEEVELILKWFCYSSIFEGEINFDSQYLYNKLRIIKENLNLSFDIDLLIHDLTVSIGIMVIDGLYYCFPHKSLQEYFAVLLIKEQEEENKVRIYSVKLLELDQKTTGGDLNIWNLCYELDKVSFIKYFLLPELDYALEGIEDNTNEEIIRSFIIKFEFSALFYSKDKLLGGTGYLCNYPSSLINFFSIDDSMGSIPSNSKKDQIKIKKIIRRYGRGDNLLIKLYHDFDHDTLELCKLTNLDKLIIKIYLSLKEKKKELENLLSREEKVANTLLNI